MRTITLLLVLSTNLIVVLAMYMLGFHHLMWFFATGAISLLGLHDYFQTKHAVLRNYPVVGHFRYMLESIRPEIQQYFVENDNDGRPFNRELRSVVYQRAKKVNDTVPFGSKLDHYSQDHEWLNHSMVPVEAPHEAPKVKIGNEQCKQPYQASLLNISAMSYGSLSGAAVEAFNWGAKVGGFAHNTGEGGVSEHHLKHGGDLIWQIGTGYFGCRTKDGNFNPEMFQEMASHPHIKMIELKISQGAKPGHGGILPGEKVTPKIAKIRGVEVGKTVYSPPYHKAFSDPKGLLRFIQQLRELSGGKPVGFKYCLGRRSQFLSICKAMLEEKIYPDYICIDGSEGGTGASPLEFTNSIGNPLNDALSFTHSALIACGLRSKIKLIAAGRIITGFDMLKKLALGADLCYSARGMMFSIGCIQALRCNSNQCPVGVATQKPYLEAGLVVKEKYMRVKNYHESTIHSLFEMMAAAGVSHPDDLRPYHVQKRLNNRETMHYGEIYTILNEGDFTSERAPEVWMRSWRKASSEHF